MSAAKKKRPATGGSDPLARAKKFLALATNEGASSEEARTAAMAACRLIVEHGLLDQAQKLSVLDTVAAGREFISDPEVQKAAGIAADLFRAVGSVVSKRRSE